MIKTSEKPAVKNPKQRVKILLDALCKQIFKEVSRSIFEKHKLLFAFMLATTILKIDNQLDNKEWTFLLTGLSGSPLADKLNPDPSWISSKLWEDILHLSNIPAFATIADDITNETDKWQQFYNDIENLSPPEPYNQLSAFQKLVLTKVFRPDLFMAKSKEFINEILGDYFTSSLIFTLEDTFKESISPLVPLIFILSPGDDPLVNIMLTLVPNYIRKNSSSLHKTRTNI